MEQVRVAEAFDAFGRDRSPRQARIGLVGFEFLRDERGMLDERHEGLRSPPAATPAEVIGDMATQIPYLSMGIIYRARLTM